MHSEGDDQDASPALAAASQVFQVKAQVILVFIVSLLMHVGGTNAHSVPPPSK